MTAVWLAAMLSVGVMGFAIQRGGTCTVAAVDEVLTCGRARRLLAMLEASLWVAGGLALAQLGHLMDSMPASYAVSAGTFIGGALLGLGAWINRACVFGAVARLGSGEWAYAATPVGFYVGCLSEMTLLSRPGDSALLETSAFLPASGLVGLGFVAFVVWRVRPGLRAWREPDHADFLLRKIWAPHAATIVIGVTFVVTLLLVGRWAYTDVLADLARAMGGGPAILAVPVVLLFALYAGALIGGRTAGPWRAAPLSVVQLLRCFTGGVVMAWGSLLIPGSNDGLILVGIPLLRPYAWLAFATMFGTIAAAMQMHRAWSRAWH